ncbi:MAG: BTAD domain-containing putative transcriptional regulator [Caldilineaceae bacterium]
MFKYPNRPKLTLQLFGAPEIHLNDELINGLSAKTQALLFYLAMTRQSHLRTTLTALLWGDLPETNARGNLRKAIQQLRAALPDQLITAGQTVALCADETIWVDAVIFEEQITEAEKNDHVKALEAAVDLYRGDFLTGFFVHNAPDFEAWQLTQQARLREQMVTALETLSQHWATNQEFARAIAVTRRIIALGPWREEAHRQLMELLAKTGQRGAALAHYEQCRQVLHDELGVEPAAETIGLYERIREDELGTHRVVVERKAPAPSHNLPAQTTPFVGRDREVAELTRLLREPDMRLVTILAPGGMGKTRLALEVAATVLDDYQNGVFFVPLAALADSASIVSTIATSVGYTFQNDDRTARQQLYDYLREKTMLLLLDNAEHLLDSVDLYVEMLQAAPQVRLLVTSRERLRLSSETLFPLTGLALSDAVNGATSAATHLFIQTAQRVRPTFTPGSDDWSALNQICQLMGGMPLGLILAAVWIEMLTPAEIAAEIGRGLIFLAADLHDLPARQRSLQSIFESAWRRLSGAERGVFQKLAIFRGGFTREAAERVAGASLQTLTTLSHKALIQRNPDGRYEIHELLRQFALDTLSDQLSDVRDQHSAYYCDFLAQRESALKGARQQAAMAEIGADSENIRMAWQWAVAKEEFGQLIDGLDSLGLYYLWRSRLDEGEALCRFALEQLIITLPTDHSHRKKSIADLPASDSPNRQTSAPNTTKLRFAIRIAIWHSLFQRKLRQFEAANATLQQAKRWLTDPLLAASENRFEQALLLFEEAETNQQTNLEASHRLIEESLQLLRELDDGWRTTQGLEILGNILATAGSLECAWQSTEQSLKLRQQLGDVRGVANSLLALSNIARWMGRFEDAIELVRQSIASFKALQDLGQQALATHYLAGHFVFGGYFAESLQIFEESIAIKRQLGLSATIGRSEFVLGFSLINLGRYEEARSQIQSAIELYSEAMAATGYKDLGRIALAEGNDEDAQQHVLKALNLFRVNGEMHRYGQALGCLGFIALRQQNLQQARTYIYESLQVAAETRMLLPSLHALTGVALLCAAAGDEAEAIELYTVALQNRHVANSRWYHDIAGQQIAAVAAALPSEVAAAARSRGQARNLASTIEALWAKLNRACRT